MPEPRFLDGSDASVRRLDAAVAAIGAALARHARPGPGPGSEGAAWSGIDTDELRALVDALDPLPPDGLPFDDVVDEVGRIVLANAVRPTDRATVAHLHSPTLLAAAATEVAIGATNQSMDSYDQAPAATLVEDRLVRRLAELCGLPPTGSGVMTAGGTASNLLGLVLARESAARRRGLDVAAEGLGPATAPWRILASADAHFSVTRAAMLMGLGRNAVVAVACDEGGAMDADALDRVADEVVAGGGEVIAVVGTAGSTDLGAIDPLDRLADVAARLGAWFHVDAAVGGALVVSHRLRPRLAGLERADSVTIDLHKLWWQPISASVLLVADEASFGLIRRHSEYLDREEDAEAGVLNLVGRSLDTSRRFDALKALLSFRATGTRTLARMLEHLVDTATSTADAIKARDDVELLATPTSVMVVFRWIGDGTLGADELDRVNTEVQRRLFDSGRAVIGRTRHRGVVALKFTLVNPLLELAHLVALVDLVAAEAAAVTAG
ncbi:MAG: pyridoxal-dependent decarboxylase [Acidimicrobiales bacterium]